MSIIRDTQQKYMFSTIGASVLSNYYCLLTVSSAQMMHYFGYYSYLCMNSNIK